MNPLNVSSSLTGLRRAASDIYNLLELASQVKNAPAAICDAKNEVGHSKLALRSVEQCLNRILLLNAERTSLIQVDEIRAVLAGAMMVFSDFESMLQTINQLTRIRMTVVWPKYLRSIESHLAKINRYNTSLLIMTNILQCETQMEALESQRSLQSLNEEILDENESLRRLINESKDSFDAVRTFKRRVSDSESLIRPESDDDDAITIRDTNIRGMVNDPQKPSGTKAILGFSFESILEQSWVYKRNQRNECDCSFISSAQRPHAWSVFSGFSLADVSVLSVIAMPISCLDITNGRHYRVEPEKEKPLERAEEPCTTKLSNKDSELLNALKLGPSSFVFEFVSNLQLNSGMNGSRDAGRSMVQTCTDNQALQKSSETIQPQTSNGTTHRNDIDDPRTVVSEGKLDMDKNENLIQDVFLCRGCGEILEEGKAFELAGNRWHLDCFRCTMCSILIDSEANLLLLRDGSLICDSCTYDCSSCHQIIEDLAILTEDQAFCTACFTCRNCKSPMLDFTYAKTPQGMFCMDCHGSIMVQRRKKALPKRITQKQ